MSPYQQDIIDTTLAEYDIQAQKGLPGLAAQAIGAGAFGGGREGVQLAEYQASSDRNRAALQAQLLGQGFGQANQLAQNAFNQQQSNSIWSNKFSTTITCIIRSTDCKLNRFRCSNKQEENNNY